MKIETERLLLRPYRSADLAHMQCYATRPAFIRYLPLAAQTGKSVRTFLEARLEEQTQAERTRFSFAIEPRGLGRLVGAANVVITDSEHRSGYIGFGLDSDFEGQGIMTEAVAAILEFGFEQLHLHRIWATADVDNTRSWRLLERVGLAREGLLRGEKLIRGAWRDSYLYAVLETDQRTDETGMRKTG